MAKSQSLDPAAGPVRKPRRSGLLLCASVPLIVFHAGLLLERAMHRESIDALVTLRWVLSIAFLIALRGLGSRLKTIDPRTLGIALVLIVALVHAPVTAPDPGLPLAAAGLGLALSMAIFDRRRGTLAVGDRSCRTTRPAFATVRGDVALRGLKDRAPPFAR